MEINRKLLIQLFIIATSSLICMQILDNMYDRPVWQFTRMFNMSIESNFPTWTSTMLLLLSAYSANQCALLIKENRKEKRAWQITAGGLLFMSFDEVAMVHEHIGDLITKFYLSTRELATGWIVILGPIVLVSLLIYAFYMHKYLKDSKRALKWICSGFFLFIAGALVLEYLVNYIAPLNISILSNSESILEEAFEMFGIIFVTVGLMHHEEYLKQKI